ncbi:MAG: tyrosine-protein phosphatase [Clostridia bacterium]|nr:tyrosine-protein phosphatase [Clostridia bacterium]
MASLLHTTWNTRLLREGDFRFVRSDVPDRLSADDLAWLLAHHITLAVDLRSPQECAARPCPLEQDPRFQYLHLPVTTGDIVPHCFEDVPNSYLDMVDGQLMHILDTLWSAGRNAIYFCNAGKDRTGVVSALLLQRMGASRQEIVDNYVLSADNLKTMLADFVAKRPELKLEVVTPRAWTMEQFLDRVPDKLRSISQNA